MQSAKTEISAGCVVYRQFGKNLEFALGKHSGYHKWVLPKGLVEKRENKIATAIRETEEELGLKVKVVKQSPIHIAKYTYQAVFKDKVKNSRRIVKYAESFDSASLGDTRGKQDKSGDTKTKVFKTVYFFLAKYISGDISKHGWEMEKAGWFEHNKALVLLAFADEKKALKKMFERWERDSNPR